MRALAAPFVVGAPSGARVRTRLRPTPEQADVLRETGQYLGRLASADLAVRVAAGAGPKHKGRPERKRALTAESSSRWAGAITRTTGDQWQRGRDNLWAQRRSLVAACGTIRRRLDAPAGGSHVVNGHRVRGYATTGERRAKQQRLQTLTARLVAVQRRLDSGHVPVVRGGRRLARQRHNLDTTGLAEEEWRHRWETQRWFLTADGETDKRLGNETIRWDPDRATVEIRLPTPLTHLANAPHGRLRIDGVDFSHRRGEVAAQTASGAVRYDISFDVERARWYLDASWGIDPGPAPTLDGLGHHSTLAVDLNVDHVAAWVIDPDGNPVGKPLRVGVPDRGSSSHRDAQVRHLVSRLLRHAHTHQCRSVTIENLDFVDTTGRDNPTHRRGRAGRTMRRKVAGIPTGRFRDRLTQMAANVGL